MLHGNTYLVNCRKFAPIIAALPISGDGRQKLWDHRGAELSSRRYHEVAGLGGTEERQSLFTSTCNAER